MNLKSIGKVKICGENMFINIDKQYINGLKELDGFSHINVFWWCDKFDNEQSRNIIEVDSPYKNSPQTMGIFATRSPLRPNPIALSTAKIIHIDYENGTIEIEFIDADNNTPLLDLKPYTPSLDRIENPKVPHWCSHWPKSFDTSSEFDWESEFNF